MPTKKYALLAAYLLCSATAKAEPPDMKACFAAAPAAVEANLADLNLAQDKNKFCPADTAPQKCFEALVKAIIQAEHEINQMIGLPHQPNSILENVGCMHLSERDGCGDLEDPVQNVSCGVKLLAKLIKRDGVISKAHQPHQGGGGSRYWSVLREPKTLPTGFKLKNNLRVKMLIGNFLKE